MGRISRKEFLTRLSVAEVAFSALLLPDNNRWFSNKINTRVDFDIQGKVVTYLAARMKRRGGVIELGTGQADQSLYRVVKDNQVVPLLAARFMTVRPDLTETILSEATPPQSSGEYGMVVRTEGLNAPKRFDGSVTVFSQWDGVGIEADTYLLAPNPRLTSRFSREIETGQVNFDVDDAWLVGGGVARPLKQSLNVKLQDSRRENGPFAVLTEVANIYSVDPNTSKK